MTNNRDFREEVTVLGNQLVGKIKELLEEGNIRRILIQDTSGKTLLEVPLNLGVAASAGLLFAAPLLAGVGAIAAVVTRARVVVERYDDPVSPTPSTTSTPRNIDIEDEEV